MARVASNRADLMIYPTIAISGAELLPQDDSSKEKVSQEEICTRLTVTETCTDYISIYGGPAHLTTKVVSSPSEGYFYKIIKESERIYRIEAIQTTNHLTESKEQENSYQLIGTERNLLTLKIYLDTKVEKDSKAIVLKTLIKVIPIQNY